MVVSIEVNFVIDDDVVETETFNLYDFEIEDPVIKEVISKYNYIIDERDGFTPFIFKKKVGDVTVYGNVTDIIFDSDILIIGRDPKILKMIFTEIEDRIRDLQSST